jgi:hypothetical protein
MSLPPLVNRMALPPTKPNDSVSAGLRMPATAETKKIELTVLGRHPAMFDTPPQPIRDPNPTFPGFWARGGAVL